MRVLTLIAYLLMAIASVSASDQPWFCHNYECPQFETKEKHDDYEVRQYKGEKWVSCVVEGEGGYDKAYRSGYTKLYSYMSGANENKQNIEMTAPVRVLMHQEHTGFEDKFTVSFFLPKRFQKDPPTPNDRNVHVEESKDMTAYVIGYGGYSTEKTVGEKAAVLFKLLTDKGVNVEQNSFYAATYDNPLRVVNRHNEIWMFEKEQSSVANNITESLKGALTRGQQYADDIIRTIA